MSNYWLDKKKKEELANIAPATKTIPVWNFEEIIKAVLDKYTLTYYCGSPDIIVSGPAGKNEIYISGPPMTEEPIYVVGPLGTDLNQEFVMPPAIQDEFITTINSDNWVLDL